MKTGIIPSFRRYMMVDAPNALADICRHFGVDPGTVPSEQLTVVSINKRIEMGGMVFIRPDLMISALEMPDELLILHPPGKYQDEVEAADQIITAHPYIKNGFYVLTTVRDTYVMRECSLEGTQTDLSKYFNDDIIKADQHIRQQLSSSRNRGFVFLHGEPGTGKSTYLKHLLGTIDRKSVLMPADAIFGLHSPALTLFLHKNPDIILVLEDIDDFIMDGNMGNNFVMNMVNFTDSLLALHTNIRFVCTFSSPLDKIAKQLRRSGRVLASHEFKPLEIEKCNAILSELHPGCKTEQDLCLADVFHYCDNKEIRPRTARIGFTKAEKR
jgi:energy-coupling factor transporter ATP-binding protein EcfA2